MQETELELKSSESIKLGVTVYIYRSTACMVDRRQRQERPGRLTGLCSGKQRRRFLK